MDGHRFGTASGLHGRSVPAWPCRWEEGVPCREDILPAPLRAQGTLTGRTAPFSATARALHLSGYALGTKRPLTYEDLSHEPTHGQINECIGATRGLIFLARHHRCRYGQGNSSRSHCGRVALASYSQSCLGIVGSSKTAVHLDAQEPAASHLDLRATATATATESIIAIQSLRAGKQQGGVDRKWFENELQRKRHFRGGGRRCGCRAITVHGTRA